MLLRNLRIVPELGEVSHEVQQSSILLAGELACLAVCPLLLSDFWAARLTRSFFIGTDDQL